MQKKAFPETSSITDHSDTPKGRIIKNNLEWVVKDCIRQFEDQKKRIILVHIDQKFYDGFKEKFLSLYKNGLVFMTVSGKIDIELISELFRTKRVVVYDKLRKLETHWIHDLPEEKRNPYIHIDADYFLNLNRPYY